MHAFLISGNSDTLRKQKIEELLDEWCVNPFDRVEMVREGASIGIKDIRDLQERLKLKPYNSPYSVAIVSEAHLLTIEAQQALLKTLEEPPPTVRIILETANKNSLLPTILSRCVIVDLGTISEYSEDDLFQCFKTLKQITTESIGTRLQKIDEIAKTREEAVAWVDLAIASGRKTMLAGDFYMSKLIRGLLTARAQISANVNPRLVLDNLFLSF